MMSIDPKKYQAENIVSKEEAIELVKDFKEQGKIVGLCSGSFDLLHPGHISHLISAKKACDILFVALARDEFSSKKSDLSGRPVFSHDLRAYMISQLKSVDFVFLENGEVGTIGLIKPSILIKGKDYADETNPKILEQKKIMEDLGGKIVYTEDEKLSTTDLIQYIKDEIK